MTQVIQLKGGKPVLDFRKLELNTTEPVYVQIVSFVKRQIFTGAAEKDIPFVFVRPKLRNLPGTWQSTSA